MGKTASMLKIETTYESTIKDGFFKKCHKEKGKKKSPNQRGLPGSLTTKSLPRREDNPKEKQLACLQAEVGETDTKVFF